MRPHRHSLVEYESSAESEVELFGREAELRNVTQSVLDPATRLISLVGVGGVGKTRLALAVFHELAPRFAGASYFVALGAIDDPEEMLREIGRVVGAKSSDQDTLSAITNAIGRAPSLLVLDNLEQLHAGPILECLLNASPGLRMLATSRTPLQIAAERVIQIEPFTVPDISAASELMTNPAIALFLARAESLTGSSRRQIGTIEAVADICRRVDGIPLAIELAAGLSRVLTPIEINAHLDQRLERLKDNRFSSDPRHTTMRATIAWSYERLRETERALFRRLSAFADGFTLDMAKRMARGRRARSPYPYADGFGVPFGHGRYLGRNLPMEEDDGPSLRYLGLEPLAIDPIDGLASLVDHSLIQRRVTPSGESRYTVYETIREFGLECLTGEREVSEVRHQHAAIMLAIFEAGIEGLYYADRTVFERNRLAVAIPNFREAMTWLEHQGAAGAEIGQRLAGCSWIFWQQSGRISEGRHWMELAFRHENLGWAYAAYLPALGFLCWIQGDDNAAERILNEALNRTAEVGLVSSEASTYLYLALVAWRKGPPAQNEMLLHLQRSFDLYQSIDEPLGIGVCTQLFGVIAQAGGDPGKALALQRDALEQYTRCGYGWGQAAANLYMGGLLMQQAAAAPDAICEGVQRLKRSFDLFATMGDSWGIGATVGVLGAVALRAERVEPAGLLLGAALGHLKSGSSFLPPVNNTLLEDAIATLRSTAGDESADRLLGAGGTLNEKPLENLVASFTSGVLAPQRQVPPPVAARNVRLTRHQAEVVRLLEQGFKPTQIAKLLGRHESSVYETIGRIQERLGVGKWEQIVPAARSLGLSAPKK